MIDLLFRENITVREIHKEIVRETIDKDALQQVFTYHSSERTYRQRRVTTGTVKPV